MHPNLLKGYAKSVYCWPCTQRQILLTKNWRVGQEAVKPPKYIIRVDNAWRVKVRQCHRSTTKQFNYDKYCGVKSALAQAIIWRDRVLDDWGMLDALNYKKSPDYRAVKNKACIGVFITSSNPHGRQSYNWASQFHKNGKEHRRHFAIEKYGARLAFYKACRIRYNHCGAIVIINRKLIPCLPDVPYRG